MEEALFRPMTKADLPAVAELEIQCFRSPWTLNMLKGELKNRLAHYHVLELDGKIIAYAGMWVLFEEAHITNVAVSPDHRRNGYGRRIMLESMRAAVTFHATQMTLEVRETNFGAQALYEGLGFQMAGRRKKYYSDTGEDAFILWNKDIVKTIEQLHAC